MRAESKDSHIVYGANHRHQPHTPQVYQKQNLWLRVKPLSSKTATTAFLSMSESFEPYEKPTCTTFLATATVKQHAFLDIIGNLNHLTLTTHLIQHFWYRRHTLIAPTTFVDITCTFRSFKPSELPALTAFLASKACLNHPNLVSLVCLHLHTRF